MSSGYGRFISSCFCDASRFSARCTLHTALPPPFGAAVADFGAAPLLLLRGLSHLGSASPDLARQAGARERSFKEDGRKARVFRACGRASAKGPLKTKKKNFRVALAPRESPAISL